MSSPEPHDPTRDASVADNEISEDRLLNALNGQEAFYTFRKGVVVEVLGDPQLRDEEFFKKYDTEEDPDEETHSQLIINFDDLAVAPRNSLVVQDVTAGSGKTDTKNIVCFPFFSSHIMFPVKPGETVWYAYIQPSSKGLRAYWLSRVHDVDYVEDVNFAHHDRKHDAVFPDPDGDPRTQPSIHNGADPALTDSSKFVEDEDETENQTLRDPDGFSKIRDKSLESKRFVIEPVPRLTKRPGDLVLQGSNNTAIVLGMDRGFGLANRPDKDNPASVYATDEKNLNPLKGSIDLVAGRGRIYSTEKFEGLAGDSAPGELTRPRIVQNAEKDFETDKNIANDPDQGADENKGPRVNLEADPDEGDPDFVNDASRVYVTMSTNVDANFASTLENIPEAYDEDPTKSTLQNKDNSAAIAIKSDEIRIIARKVGDKQTNLKDAEYSDAADSGINGSIRIIKEGTPGKAEGDDGDAAAIYLLPDGTIQITGRKIMIGKSTERDEGTAKHTGGKDTAGNKVGKTEPYMRYTEFKQWAAGLIDAINTSITNAQAAINANGDALNNAGSAGSSGGMTPGMGAPNAAVGAAFGMCQQSAGMSGKYDSQEDQDAIAEFKDTSQIKSKRIFGE